MKIANTIEPLRGIWKLYDDKDQQEKGIAILEELKLGFAKKGQTKAVLLELLGDAYKEADDTKQAEALYAEWLAIRQKEVTREQRSWGHRNLGRSTA